MWKNLTTPNLLKYKCQRQIKEFPCDLSFSEAGIKDIQLIGIESSNDFGSGSLQYQSKTSHSDHQKLSNKQKYKRQEVRNNIASSKLSKKQQFILNELEQNEQLRMNLFKAEKTIIDLDNVCKSMHHKMTQLLLIKKEQIQKYNLQKQQIKTKLISLSQDKKTEKQGGNSKNKQHANNKSQIKKETTQLEQILYKQISSQQEIAEMWKKSYNQIMNFISDYTKDINFLTQQYKVLQSKNQLYKRSSSKAKIKEEKLMKILQQSNFKLRRTENTIQKAILDIKQKDNQLQECQIQNKNMKMKIIQLREEIEKYKKEIKLNVRDIESFKQAGKSIKAQLQSVQVKYKQLQCHFNNQIKKIEFLAANQQNLKSKMKVLQEQLNSLRAFNENIIEQYKKMSSKIQYNQQKLSQRYLVTQQLYSQRLEQYQKFMNTLKKQKQLSAQKFSYKIELAQVQIQKLLSIKKSLQEQLLDRSFIITKLQNQLSKKQQKIHNVEMQLNTRIQQKERQIEYLQQLRQIGNQKNQQTKAQLQEVRADMMTIIDQLKIKQLQIQKLRNSYNNNCSFSKSLNKQKQVNKKDNFFKGTQQLKFEGQKRIRQSSAALYNDQVLFSGEKKSRQNFGLVWRKLREDNRLQEQFQQQPQPICQNNIENFDQTNAQQNVNQLIPGLIDLKLPYNRKNSQIELSQNIKQQNQQNNLERKWSYLSQINNNKHYQVGCNKTPSKQKQVKTFNEEFNMRKNKNQNKIYQENQNPKSKFNLQAFQNKMFAEESGKILMKLNKTLRR